MLVVGHDILGVAGHRTVHKLVVVGVVINQAEMDVYFLINSGLQTGDGFNHVVSHISVGFACQDFLVLVQDFRVHAKTDTALQDVGSNLVVRAGRGQRLQQAVGVKNDATHGDKVCACVLRPIVQLCLR